MSAGTPPHSTETVAEVLALTCSEPPGEVAHWTGRAVVRAVGISLRAVQRIWDTHRRRRLQRGYFTGVVDLQAAIKRYIAEHN